MVVLFSKKQSNYVQQNLIDILKSIPDPTIRRLAKHSKDHVKVIGDIHRSQWIAENPFGLFWFKIKGQQNNQNIPYLSSVHIYVCYRLLHFNSISMSYTPGYCIAPNPIPNTDLPDLTGLMGHWEYAGISFD